ncbi:hypothetical protein DF039_34300 [Burkholderia cenocepacia]|nr:hypothetical protein DF039_34300 [Burkholderia cenocepacia]
MHAVATSLGGSLDRVKVPISAIEQQRAYARANFLCDVVAVVGFVVATAMACYWWWPPRFLY